MVNAVQILGQLKGISWENTNFVNVYVLADGLIPFTSITMSLFYPLWNYASIDPILDYDSKLLGLYICIYICIYIYMYISIYVYIYIIIDMNVFVTTYMYTYIYIYIYICIYIYVYIYMHICMYIYIFFPTYMNKH
jgi:hypothetical protein